jgi:hypothetical protein
MEHEETTVEPLNDDQATRAHALALAADLGKGSSPLGHGATKWVPWELIYLADYITKGSMLEVDDSVVLPRPLASHAAVALAMSPSDEDQECARRIEAELAKYEGSEQQ